MATMTPAPPDHNTDPPDAGRDPAGFPRTSPPTMATPPAALVDALNGLLDAEQSSLFRFMGGTSPYLTRATVELRRQLDELARSTERHVAQLVGAIDRLGGDPLPRRLVAEEQYLAYLSLKFLLPKLIEAKRLTVERYENVLAALSDPPADVRRLLEAHLAEHRQHLEALQKARQPGL